MRTDVITPFYFFVEREGDALTRVDVFITGNDLAAIPLLTGLHVESYSGGRFLFHHPQTGFKFNFGIPEPETPGRQASEDVSDARCNNSKRRESWPNVYAYNLIETGSLIQPAKLWID